MATAAGDETDGLNSPVRYSHWHGNAGMVIRGATAIIKDRRLLYRPAWWGSRGCEPGQPELRANVSGLPAFSGEGLIDVLA